MIETVLWMAGGAFITLALLAFYTLVKVIAFDDDDDKRRRDFKHRHHHKWQGGEKI